MTRTTESERLAEQLREAQLAEWRAAEGAEAELARRAEYPDAQWI